MSMNESAILGYILTFSWYFFYTGEVVFNVLGFSQQHDDNFLNLLSLIGTSDGSYNFVSPSEGDSALHEILVGMVSNFSTSIGRLMNLEVTIVISLPLFLRERRVNFCESLETVYRVKCNAEVDKPKPGR